uniref:Protein xylosyltransferase n=2 Tax=Chrysotila carterae TaxID=13221 RepID=A0A7S4B4Z2_CHRCT
MAAAATSTRPESPAHAQQGAGPAIIAYLFTLRRGRHPLPGAWTTYFAGCEMDSFAIHIHKDPSFSPPSQNLSNSRFFNNTIIDRSVHIERMGYTMVQARLYLLRHAVEAAAAAGRPPPRWFAFLSDSDAPTVTCAEAHAYVSTREGKSFIRVDRPMTQAQRDLDPMWIKSFSEKTCPLCRDVGIMPAHYRHTTGWITLWLEHAQLFLSTEERYAAALRSWTYDRVVMGIADESYWGTISTAHQLSLWEEDLTYQEPGHSKSGHPALFRPSDVPRVFAAAAVPPRHIFARKFETSYECDAAIARALAPNRSFPSLVAGRMLARRHTHAV